ncbi:adhesion G-protein coupled receptor G7-like [Hypanus sabinus]|uniref:adhesion G-protein coupled receptor G7-like n=1 Tax=Hypanus sabinus TaxID=79690 RepID=UPI0028C3A2BE|nr:adhesion G-protein coupled receptor G7-like [Hypanus sabinus]
MPCKSEWMEVDSVFMEDVNIYIAQVCESFPASQSKLDEVHAELKKDQICSKVVQYCEHEMPPVPTELTNSDLTATFLLHFFLLASFAWMCVQGVALYSSFNRIIQQLETSYFPKVATGVAWGVPALIAIITIGATYSNKYRQDKICWLAIPREGGNLASGENVLLWAFLLPVSLMLLVNMVIFGLIMSKMICNQKNLKAYRGEFKKTLQKNFAIIFANTVTLGISWVIGYLMLINATYEFFSTLFCILNSFQGVLIFLLCMMNIKGFRDRMKQPLKILTKEKRTNISMSRLIVKGD